ncbi:MAG: hypothetical protein PF690_09895 [Deltaproteobacteria bacterium]|jgi:hypothetical protein|nr:hypothetical protein [Deltaproteobacteria bacterium]
MITKLHKFAAVISTLSITVFFISSILVELFASHQSIAIVKSLIVIPGLFILIPAIAMTGGTGFVLSKTRKGLLVKNKKRRMPFIAANGILILIPSAIVLNYWAASGMFENRFYLIQSLELLAGAINLTLMTMNMRDGLKMTVK